MTSRTALARHRDAAGRLWPKTSARQMVMSWEYDAAVVRRFSPGADAMLARLANLLVRELAAHLARLLMWPLDLPPVAAADVSCPGTVTRWLSAADFSHCLDDLVRSCPSTGPPAVAVALGAPVISP